MKQLLNILIILLLFTGNVFGQLQDLIKKNEKATPFRQDAEYNS